MRTHRTKRWIHPLRVILLGFAVLLLLVMGCDGAASDGGATADADSGIDSVRITPISPERLLSNPPEDAMILDVRSPGEFASGHVPNAVNIPHTEIASRLSELPADRTRPLVVYCESGRRAANAEAKLLEAGFQEVHHLEGDMRAWRGAGRPMERAEG